MRLRVMLVERSTLVRSGLRRVLEHGTDIAVVCEARDARDALDALTRHDVAAIVVCSTMDREACRAPAIASLRQAGYVGIVCVSHWTETRDVEAVLSAGAAACVEISDALDTDLRHAVRQASQGKQYVSPGVLDGAPSNGSSVETDDKRLTTREREVLVLIAKSMSTREIAHELKLSTNTIAVHRNHIMKKIGVRKATALALFAAERGLVRR